MNTITRDQVIADEQKAVDRAYDCYAARLAEMTGTSAATASASGKDGIANRLGVEEKAAAYGGLGGESLVTARVDAPEEPGGEPRPWYVGRRAVSDVLTRDTVVVLWTSPLATKWFAAQAHAPGEVVLRRQLRCVERVVEDYFDDIAPAVPVPPFPYSRPSRSRGRPRTTRPRPRPPPPTTPGRGTCPGPRRLDGRAPPSARGAHRRVLPPMLPGSSAASPCSRTTSCSASSSARAAAACGTSSRPSAVTRWTWSRVHPPTSSWCRADRARASPQSVCTA